jgi:hypothetical protein
MTKSRWTAMIFREMSRKLKSPRARRRGGQKAQRPARIKRRSACGRRGGGARGPIAHGKKCVPAAPAEPDAPRDTPTDKQVSDFSRWTVARCTAHCLTRTFATTNQVLLAQELAAKCLRLTNLKVEIPTTKTAIHPWITEMLNKGYGKFPPPSKKAAE